MMSIAGGFLVPLKTKGSIRLVDLSTGTPQRPTEMTTGSDDHHWFYHRVLWLDMNGDGKKDAVTCRAKKSLLGKVMHVYIGTDRFLWVGYGRVFILSLFSIQLALINYLILYFW